MESQIPTQNNDDATESTKQEWQTPQLSQIEMDSTDSGAFVCTDEGVCICNPSS